MLAIGRTLVHLPRPKFSLNSMDLSRPPFLDPIVLCPVYIQGEKIMQIVTAWGVEADDDYISKGINKSNSQN